MIDAAATAVVQRGWRGLRMGAIAAQVGVSRQTIYNEFTTKGGLAQALAGTAVDRVLDRVDAALDTADDLSAGWTLATRIALEAAAEEQLLKTLLSAESIQEFLPLFTTESGLITRGRTRVAESVCRRWPDLDRDRVEIAAEAAVRLAVSHVLMPMHPADDIAQQAGWLLAGCLNAPVPASGPGPQTVKA
ncbi:MULTISPECIES: TetR family transcriptional regulator [unclassified Pseudonocardia]|uniref:TetR family transcriptional regulator n=1 Tax=unclassified Pseudonocardia TaxID=2619320 RepID=UPI0012F69672|nr:TetR family transcriptional regulator [Pseudonocardia sp. Ae707_Ps1]